VKILIYILAIVFGVFLFVYGGYDDSPGGQMLGLVVVTVSIVGIAKRKNLMSKRGCYCAYLEGI